MNLEKVVFSFFMILALTLNFGFFIGEVDNPAHHNVYELYAVLVVNLIATVMKFGDRSQLGAMLLATSLVAVVQLISATIVWTVCSSCTGNRTDARCHVDDCFPQWRRHAGKHYLGNSADDRSSNASPLTGESLTIH